MPAGKAVRFPAGGPRAPIDEKRAKLYSGEWTSVHVALYSPKAAEGLRDAKMRAKQRGKVMGDKSKKDKDKGAKQNAVKQQQKAKAKSEKQPKKGS